MPWSSLHIFRVIFWWLRGKFPEIPSHAHNLPDAVNNRWIHSQTSNILFNVWNLRHQNIALPIRHCSSQSKCDREVHLKDVPRLVQYANYQKLLDLEWKFLLYASTPLRYALKTTNEIPISAHYVSQPGHHICSKYKHQNYNIAKNGQSTDHITARTHCRI